MTQQEGEKYASSSPSPVKQGAGGQTGHYSSPKDHHKSSSGGKFHSPKRFAHAGSSEKKHRHHGHSNPLGKSVEIMKGKRTRLLLVQSHRAFRELRSDLVITCHPPPPINLLLLFISDKLYWIADAKPPQNIENAFFFNIDNVSGKKYFTFVE